MSNPSNTPHPTRNYMPLLFTNFIPNFLTTHNPSLIPIPVNVPTPTPNAIATNLAITAMSPYSPRNAPPPTPASPPSPARQSPSSRKRSKFITPIQQGQGQGSGLGQGRASGSGSSNQREDIEGRPNKKQKTGHGNGGGSGSHNPFTNTSTTGDPDPDPDPHNPAHMRFNEFAAAPLPPSFSSSLGSPSTSTVETTTNKQSYLHLNPVQARQLTYQPSTFVSSLAPARGRFPHSIRPGARPEGDEAEEIEESSSEDDMGGMGVGSGKGKGKEREKGKGKGSGDAYGSGGIVSYGATSGSNSNSDSDCYEISDADEIRGLKEVEERRREMGKGRGKERWLDAEEVGGAKGRGKSMDMDMKVDGVGPHDSGFGTGLTSGSSDHLHAGGASGGGKRKRGDSGREEVGDEAGEEGGLGEEGEEGEGEGGGSEEQEEEQEQLEERENPQSNDISGEGDDGIECLGIRSSKPSPIPSAKQNSQPLFQDHDDDGDQIMAGPTTPTQALFNAYSAPPAASTISASPLPSVIDKPISGSRNGNSHNNNNKHHVLAQPSIGAGAGRNARQSHGKGLGQNGLGGAGMTGGGRAGGAGGGPDPNPAHVPPAQGQLAKTPSQNGIPLTPPDRFPGNSGASSFPNALNPPNAPAIARRDGGGPSRPAGQMHTRLDESVDPEAGNRNGRAGRGAGGMVDKQTKKRQLSISDDGSDSEPGRGKTAAVAKKRKQELEAAKASAVVTAQSSVLEKRDEVDLTADSDDDDGSAHDWEGRSDVANVGKVEKVKHGRASNGVPEEVREDHAEFGKAAEHEKARQSRPPGSGKGKGRALPDQGESAGHRPSPLLVPEEEGDQLAEADEEPGSVGVDRAAIDKGGFTAYDELGEEGGEGDGYGAGESGEDEDQEQFGVVEIASDAASSPAPGCPSVSSHQDATDIVTHHDTTGQLTRAYSREVNGTPGRSKAKSSRGGKVGGGNRAQPAAAEHPVSPRAANDHSISNDFVDPALNGQADTSGMDGDQDPGPWAEDHVDSSQLDEKQKPLEAGRAGEDVRMDRYRSPLPARHRDASEGGGAEDPVAVSSDEEEEQIEAQPDPAMSSKRGEQNYAVTKETLIFLARYLLKRCRVDDGVIRLSATVWVTRMGWDAESVEERYEQYQALQSNGPMLSLHEWGERNVVHPEALWWAIYKVQAEEEAEIPEDPATWTDIALKRIDDAKLQEADHPALAFPTQMNNLTIVDEDVMAPVPPELDHQEAESVQHASRASSNDGIIELSGDEALDLNECHREPRPRLTIDGPVHVIAASNEQAAIGTRNVRNNGSPSDARHRRPRSGSRGTDPINGVREFDPPAGSPSMPARKSRKTSGGRSGESASQSSHGDRDLFHARAESELVWEMCLYVLERRKTKKWEEIRNRFTRIHAFPRNAPVDALRSTWTKEVKRLQKYIEGIAASEIWPFILANKDRFFSAVPSYQLRLSPDECRALWDSVFVEQGRDVDWGEQMKNLRKRNARVYKTLWASAIRSLTQPT